MDETRREETPAEAHAWRAVEAARAAYAQAQTHAGLEMLTAAVRDWLFRLGEAAWRDVRGKAAADHADDSDTPG